MQIELTVLISVISAICGVAFGFHSLQRTKNIDTKEDSSERTTIIVKLENIGTGINRIENELTSLKEDFKEDHERLVKLESSVRVLWDRVERCEVELGRKVE